MASVLALVALYRRTGALPARRLLHEKHVVVVQVLDWQPYRSWMTNLWEMSAAKKGERARKESTFQQEY